MFENASEIFLRRSSDGLPATWPTRLRLEASAEWLEVRFECQDERAWGSMSERDAPLWQEEVVEVFLAPTGDSESDLLAAPREYIELEVSPKGALFDAWVKNPQGDRSAMTVDTAWDWPGIEWRAGRLPSLPADRQDWWAELRLPWRGLGYDAAPLFLRANFYRVERPSGAAGPDDEYTAWSPTWADPPDFHRPDMFGLVVAGSALVDADARRRVESFRRASKPVAVLDMI